MDEQVEGVNEVESPSTETAAPQTEEAAAPTEEHEVEEEEHLPFGKHPRWQKMTASNREMKEQLAQMQEQLKTLEGAKNLDRWLREDPEGCLAYLNSQIKKQEAVQDNPDEFSKFDEDTIPWLKKIKMLEEKVTKYEQEKEYHQKTSYEQRVVDNRNALDQEFDKMAQTVGWLDKEGKGDEEFMGVVANATMARLHAVAKDPNLPTKEELKSAFDFVAKGLKAVEKKALKSTVVPPPPSGSNGRAVTGKAPQTDNERIMDIANSL